MRFLFYLLLFVFSAAFMVVSLVYIIAKTFGTIGFSPNTKGWKNLMTKLRAMTNVSLHEWESDSLTTLSYHVTNEKKTGWSSTRYGIFTAVFQEPMIAFAKQGKGRGALALARHSGAEFIFHQKGKETEIWLNNQPYGVYMDGALLSSGRSPKLMARVEVEPESRQFPVVLRDKVSVTINNKSKAITPFPRVLLPLENMTKEEETAILALALVFMLEMN